MSNASSKQGTFSFLFTDVEQSSALWESFSESMAEAIGLHDKFTDLVVQAHGGRIFKKTGDGMCAVFANPAAAILAAIDIQAELEGVCAGGLPLRVRMAVHTGVAIEREGDFFGEALSRVSRVMGLAAGGQLLLSRSAASIVTATQNLPYSVRDLGSHRLRGLTTEENVYQVLHPSLSSERPTTLAAKVEGRLPLPSTTFIGRSVELEHLRILIETQRLVTMIGAGGIGKTRLSIEAARTCMPVFEHGVWFVSLESVTEPNRVMATAASAFGVKESSDVAIEDATVKKLGGRKLLLVIDNCEHVLEAASSAIRYILANTPNVHVLATSRVVLGLSGERVFGVPSLKVPQEPDAAGARGSEAIRLFVDRAVCANPQFRVNETNLVVLCKLVKRLDGVPLALELAAARMRAMSLEQLLQRLDDSFAVLASGYKDQLPRHQTLLATMQWSYKLLSPKEKALFAKVSVFAGSFSLSASETIATAKLSDRSHVLELLASLSDKSLIIAEEWRGEMRYRLLETVRAFARTRLRERRDEEDVRSRFFIAMLGVASQLSVGIRGKEQLKWRRVFDLEIDNLRAAIEYGIGRPELVEEVARLVCRLAHMWLMRGQFSEACAYLDRIYGLLPQASIALRAKVQVQSGALRVQAGNKQGLRMMRDAVLLAESADVRTLIECLDWLAVGTFDSGEYEEAEKLYLRELALVESVENVEEGHVRLALGAIAVEKGDFTSADEHYRTMLQAKRARGDIRGVGLALCYTAHLKWLSGDSGVTPTYRQALSHLAAVPDYYSLAANLAAGSIILILEDAPEAAAQVQGFAEMLVDRVGAPVDRHVALIQSAARSKAIEMLSEELYEHWFDEGKLLDIEQVIDLLGCTQQVRELSDPVFAVS
jgi:predicted ATPase/class 3 adenylate cyclase